MKIGTRIGLSMMVVSLGLIGCASTAAGSAQTLAATQAPGNAKPIAAGVGQVELEQSGFDLENHHDNYAAFLSFCNAAILLSKQTGTEAAAAYGRNIDNAIRVLSKIQIQKLKGPSSVRLNAAFAEPFVAVVQDRDGKRLAAIPMVAQYQDYRGDGAFVTQKLSAQSDESGLVSINQPSPTAVGTYSTILAIDITTVVNQLKSRGSPFEEGLKRLVQAVEAQEVRLDYAVQSEAKSFTTAVIIQDLDAKGGILRGSDQSQQALIKELSALGFKVPVLLIGPAYLEHKEEFDILGQLKPIFGSRAQRFTFGSVKISSVAESTESATVGLSGTIQVADVQNQKSILKISRTVSATGPKLADATKNAYAAMAKELAESLARELP